MRNLLGSNRARFLAEPALSLPKGLKWQIRADPNCVERQLFHPHRKNIKAKEQ